jgi:hypothetical protein
VERERESPVIPSRWRFLAPALALGAILAACDSTPRQGEKPAAEVENADSGSVVVPQQCLEQLGDFVNRKQLVLADRVVIDATSKPFFGSVTVTVDPQVVEKTEAVDAPNRLNLIRLRNISDQTNLESVLPKIRVGDGLEIVATKEILLRFHNRISSSRPLYFQLRAQGDVLYMDSHAPSEVRREGPEGELGIRLEVVQVKKGMMYREAVE